MSEKKRKRLVKQTKTNKNAVKLNSMSNEKKTKNAEMSKYVKRK